MRFTENELKIIYQYSEKHRDETINRLDEIISEIKEETAKNLIKNTIEKLQKAAEPKCGNGPMSILWTQKVESLC